MRQTIFPAALNRWSAMPPTRFGATANEKRVGGNALHLRMRACWLLILVCFSFAPAFATETNRSAAYMRWNLDWNVTGGLPEKTLLLSLQGLANRSAPQFYIIHPREYQW